MPLPAPTGPHAVGTASVDLTDPSRPRHLLHDQPGRLLRVQAWYPAASPARGRPPERIWSELREDPATPPLARAMLALLRARAAAWRALPALPQVAAGLPLVYHHGFISFAAENSSLLASLASHGRLVLAIQHQQQLQELQALQRAQPAADRRMAEDLAARLQRAAPADRAAMARGYYAASANANRITLARAADTSFVLDHLQEVLAAIPGWTTPGPSANPQLAEWHITGFSLGGAVAISAALQDPRLRTVTSLDGGTQGAIDATRLRQPMLMLYSAANEGLNDFLLPDHARRESLPGTRHLNYHDLAGLAPLLRLTPALGRASPSACLQQRNRLVQEFLCTHDA